MVFVVWGVETFVGVFDDVLQERAKLEADRKKAELARMEAERKVCCPISLIAPSTAGALPLTRLFVPLVLLLENLLQVML